MSFSYTDLNNQTIWVVAKITKSIYEDIAEPTVEVEAQGYWDKSYADKRVKHILEHDGLEAQAWPVNFWAPPAAAAVPVPIMPEYWPPLGALTSGRGQELIDYGGSSRPLTQIVGDFWTSWRQQQADLGNLDEAGQEQPSNEQLARLYLEDHQEPVQLPLPGFEMLVH